MKIVNIILSITLVIGIVSASFASYSTENFSLDDPYSSEFVVAKSDTIPLEDRYDDYITDPNTNPFDLDDPDIIEKSIEYDPESGDYIITEKIGEEYYRMPSYMSFDEYMEHRAKEQEREYFNKLSGVSSGDSESGLLDPIQKFDLKNDLIDRLFGGTAVDIKTQGNIDLTFGVDYQKILNPILTERQQRQGGFDFDMNIQMNVVGKIGEKLNLATSYNTQATFDFENQMKLDYNSDQFSEDEIIKKIEAGNVSLPLRSSLIQGSQSLFGLKTELQFGRFWVTALASQQKSRREELTIQGGSQLQNFEVFADEYDEFRHYFLSHYNRSVFEQSLENLPQINSLFKVTKLEVWITNDRQVTNQQGAGGPREIVAFADLGEYSNITNDNPQYQSPNTSRNLDIYQTGELPNNNSNDIYDDIKDDGQARLLERAVSTLQSKYQFTQGKDFEKVRARPLTQNEYDFNPDLGFVSINVNVRPDQILGIAYEYTYNGKVYQVGEFSTDVPRTNPADTTQEHVLFVKMLKSATPNINRPAWDLMMKNIYAIGAFQVNREDFKLDIFYEDPGGGEKRFLPETNLEGTPLLRVFNLDKLNVQGDPHPDGIFDFVPGVTINTRNGRIMFPVLEPFGSGIGDKIDDPGLAQRYTYSQLYDSTLTKAREFPEFNRFAIRGSYKSSVSSEISLGAFNLPPGSVRVSAGAQQLKEGIDYEVDYNIGRVRILNDAILNSGVPVRVSFEDNTLFGFQTKTMVGLRGEYRFNPDFSIGGTYMHLFERPFTQKVNIGDDPINNRVYGLDVSLSKEAPWLTKLVDGIPFLDTKAASSINFVAEGAFLKPGHSKAINQGEDKTGNVYLDDFEGSASSFDLRTPANRWFLASVPQNDGENNNPCFPESALIDTTLSGVNRALLNWYRMDPSVRCGNERVEESYCAAIRQQEVFPNLQIPPGQSTVIQSLDLTYYPDERGPYNFDMPNGTEYSDGITQQGRLINPETRWAGIMRELTTNDFEQANIEFIEFWVLSPFLPQDDVGISGPGDFYINLGNVSEDILRDSRQSFENGLPGVNSNTNRPTAMTNLGRVPQLPPVNANAFDNDQDNRTQQDVGLDGLNDDEERVQFQEVYNAYDGYLTGNARSALDDIANDDFLYFNDDTYGDNATPLDRYRQFNNPEGNSQTPQPGQSLQQSGTNYPDKEDLNDDNTLNETESYFQYKIPMVHDGQGGIEPNEFMTDVREPADGLGRKWYRFKVPLDQYTSRVGGIQDFRSIRFMRMYMKGFDRRVTLRFARLELVRNQWRRYFRSLEEASVGSNIDEGDNTAFDVNAINIEENGGREPFNYVLPQGIEREQSLGAFPQILQNEQSLSMNICNLTDGDSRAIFKRLNLNMTNFDRVKMFVHAEALENQIIDKGEVSMFMRIGSDFEKNYYEYEIPLNMSDPENLPIIPPGGGTTGTDEQYINEVWQKENDFDFLLDSLVIAKRLRNQAGASLGQPFAVDDVGHPGNVIKVKGNPSLGLVKGIMVGVRNRKDDGTTKCVEVWINELRVSGLNEKGGGAALARLDLQLADFGNLSLSGNYSSIGWGGMDQKLAQRSQEEIIQYDIATNLELGKFLPENSGVKLPFYFQHSTTKKSPRLDPYDLDIELDEKIADAPDAPTRDSIRNQAQDNTSITSYNFTNVRKERTGEGTPMPWDVSNFSLTYAYTKTKRSDPIIQSNQIDQHRGSLSYNYSIRPTYITPFKKLIKNDKYLKFIKEVNLNPLPNTFSFNTGMDRQLTETKYRFAGDDPFINTFYDKRFTWDRNYNLNWDIMKALKFNFSAVNTAVIDELQEFVNDENDPLYGTRRSKEVLDNHIKENIRNLGRTKNYSHNANLSLNIPTKNFFFLDWINAKAQYGTTYSWNAAALNVEELGNVIQNSQDRQINADFNFEQLYDKSKYLKKINDGKRKKKRRSSTTRPSSRTPSKDDDKDGKKKKKKKKEREPSAAERIALRPLMLLRKAKFSYSESFSTVIPGYMPQTKFFGLDDGFTSPGWDFVGGLQPDLSVGGWLDDAADNGWITDDVFMNQEVIQNSTQNINAGITIEPFNDFRIDLDATKAFTENHSEFFKDTLNDGNRELVHLIPRDIGSYNSSFFAMNTLFNDDIVGLFNTYEDNRDEISQRLGVGDHPIDKEFGNYTEGYGRYQQDVLIPAFLAAYTGKGTDEVVVGTDQLFNTLPKLNWRLTYNGLNKLPWFEEYFTSFSLKHGYKSNLTINTFRTDLQYDPQNVTQENETTRNFFSRFEIPQLVVTEQFAPLFGLDMKLKNDMDFRVDFKKSRDLQMSFTDSQLSETKTSEYTIGWGWRKKDVVIGFLTPGYSKKKKSSKRKKKSSSSNDGQDGEDEGVEEEKGNDLNFKFDFSLRDDITISHLLDKNVTEATRGTNTLRVSPSIDYDVNKQLNVRLFLDYSRTRPKTSQAYPITNIQGGVTVRFSLN